MANSINKAFKGAKPDLFGRALNSEGQLKERSEGDQAQWQTALGEVVGGGVLIIIKLAVEVYCIWRARSKSPRSLASCLTNGLG